MKKILLLGGSLALLMIVSSIIGCSAGSPALSGTPSTLKVNLSSQQEGIWVNGQGKVSVVPDIANLRLGIESQETSVATAQSRANEAMDKIMTVLTDNGIAEKDIQTQYFNIRRVTRWDNDNQKEIVIGYRVTNVVTAKIREIDKIGAIIDNVATAGGDLTRIDNISFSVDDPSPYYDEARQKAIADARSKAEQLADEAGVKLGKPSYISESTPFSPPVYAEGIRMAAPAPMQTSISPGEMEISLTVQIAYSILN